MYCVYWIKREGHTNIETEGYVGITKNFKERMRAHRKNKKKSPFVGAIKSYGWDNLIKIVLHDNLTIEQALQIERKLRPTQNIGWNLLVGGILGVNSEWYNTLDNKLKHSKTTSENTKKGIADKDTPELRAERARNNWKESRESYKNISVGGKNPRALLNEDQVREIKYKLIPQGLTNVKIAELYNVKHYVISFIRSGKNWSHI